MDTKPPICVESTYWWIVTSDGRKTFVGTGRNSDIYGRRWCSAFGFKFFAIPGSVRESYRDRDFLQDYVYYLKEIKDYRIKRKEL
ncbi:hypothetical protein DY000_02049801 [Brassica cretica]|uniref:Uncharacterized protein n=1 Tax=Brassica cretica TaxID=69181 RepID=A0ABQ7EVF7_BRACR|nr:hypothetical protein DY000_02049801 [Brassica cretica]